MDNGFITTADFIRANDKVMIEGSYRVVLSAKRYGDWVTVVYKVLNVRCEKLFTYNERVKILQN